MEVLVTYVMIPEETKMAVVDMSDDEWRLFSFINGKIVDATPGLTGEDAVIISAIEGALCEEEGASWYYNTNLEQKYFGKWVDCIIKDLEQTDLTEVTKRITTGVVL